MNIGTAANIEIPEVVEEINRLIKSGVDPINIDYDEIVFQANLNKSKEYAMGDKGKSQNK